MAETCDDCGKDVASLCDDCGCCKACCKTKYCGKESEEAAEDEESDDF